MAVLIIVDSKTQYLSFDKGDKGESPAVSLYGPTAGLIAMGSEEWYVLEMPESYGDITQVTVSIDCHGMFPSW